MFFCLLLIDFELIINSIHEEKIWIRKINIVKRLFILLSKKYKRQQMIKRNWNCDESLTWRIEFLLTQLMQFGRFEAATQSINYNMI